MVQNNNNTNTDCIYLVSNWLSQIFKIDIEVGTYTEEKYDIFYKVGVLYWGA